jgi:hypothetical protein
MPTNYKPTTGSSSITESSTSSSNLVVDKIPEVKPVPKPVKEVLEDFSFEDTEIDDNQVPQVTNPIIDLKRQFDIDFPPAKNHTTTSDEQINYSRSDTG